MNRITPCQEAADVVDVRMDEDGLSKYYRLKPAFMSQMQEMLEKLLTYVAG